MHLPQRLSLIAGLLLLTASALVAETRQFLLIKADGAWRLTAQPPDPAPQGQLIVTVKGIGDPPAPAFTLSYRTKATQQPTTVALAPIPVDKSTWTTALSLADTDTTQDFSLSVTVGGTALAALAFRTSTGSAPSGGLTQLDIAAASWWQASRAQQIALVSRAGVEPGARILVHLPSGDPAESFPASVPEPGAFQVYYIMPLAPSRSAEVSVESCPTVTPFRTQGTFDFGAFQSKENQFVLVPVGQAFTCGAGSMVYQFKTTQRDKPDDATQRSVTIRIRPVYHLLATIGYGFDSTRAPSFSIENGKIAGHKDAIGTGLRAGFIWAPFGVDYEHVRWWQTFANLCFLVDPKTPTEDFSVGLAFTRTGGISLAIGVSFHRVTALNGVKEGDPFTGPGDIPTQKRWSNAGGQGVFIGFAMDKTVFTAAKSLFGAK